LGITHWKLFGMTATIPECTVGICCGRWGSRWMI